MIPPRSGITALPGIRESLRLLLEEEEYSVVDVAMMFQRTHQRIRVLCAQWGINHKSARKRGLFATRVWDDVAHRFRPVSRGNWTKALAADRRRRQLADARTRRDERRARLIRVTETLRLSLQRDPTFREIWCAFTGRAHRGQRSVSWTAIRVLNAWGRTRSTQTTAELLREFRHAAGLKPVNQKYHRRRRATQPS